MTSTRSYEWGMIKTLWYRDVLRLARERSRWMGVVMQPLLFWILIGSGMADAFQVAGSGDYLEYFYPGIIVMTILFTTIFATMSIIEDRQSGFLQGVLVAPGSRAALVAGKIAGVTSIAFVQTVVLVLLAPLAGYGFGEIAWLQLLGMFFLISIGLTALNFSMAWVLQSSQAYHAIMSVVLIPLWLISGAMFPKPDTWVGHVMTVNPMTYAVDAMRACLAGGSSDIEGTSSLMVCTLVLTGFAVAGFLLSTALANRTPRGTA